DLFEQTLAIFEDHYREILIEITQPGGTQLCWPPPQHGIRRVSALMRRVWWHIPAHPSADPPRSEGPVRVGPFLTHCGLRVEIASLARGRSSYPKSWSGPICLDRAGPVGYRARHRRVFPEASLIVSPPGYKKRAQRRFLRRHLDPLMLRGCLKSGWSA